MQISQQISRFLIIPLSLCLLYGFIFASSETARSQGTNLVEDLDDNEIYLGVKDFDSQRTEAATSNCLQTIYRYWYESGQDHLYTTHWNELENGNSYWKREADMGYIAKSANCYYSNGIPIYRYYNPNIIDHLYTNDWNELGTGKGGYEYEGILGYVSPSSDSEHRTTALYRYWNADIQDHMYTIDWNELGYGKGGYIYEGILGYVVTTSDASSTCLQTIYRYWNESAQDHLYTTHWSELENGHIYWKREADMGYIAKSANCYFSNGIPIYRYYDPNIIDHLYTNDWNELGAGKGGYEYEGILGYLSPSSGPDHRTTALYRYWNASIQDHMYTINWEELGYGKGGYVYEGILGYVATTSDVSSTTQYFSSSTGGKVDNIRFADEDILAFNPDSKSWQTYFDGSDVILGGADVDAFHILADGNILLSLDRPWTIDGVRYDDSDIIKFAATSLGNHTRGTFSMYLDGSDVQLTTNGEDIDAIALLKNGDLVLSTLGTARVTGVVARDEDMIRFHKTQLGNYTQGTWSLYFDASDVELAHKYEDIWAVSIDESIGQTLLSTHGVYNAGGLKGDSDDILACDGWVGSNTTCKLSLKWDGDAHNFGSERIDGYSIGPAPVFAAFSAAADDGQNDDPLEIDDVSEDILDDDEYTEHLYLPIIER